MDVKKLQRVGLTLTLLRLQELLKLAHDSKTKLAP